MSIWKSFSNFTQETLDQGTAVISTAGNTIGMATDYLDSVSDTVKVNCVIEHELVRTNANLELARHDDTTAQELSKSESLAKCYADREAQNLFKF